MIIVEKIDDVYLRWWSDDQGVESEIVDYFTYDFPGARFTPQYKARLWDGRIRLADPIRKKLYVGLYTYLEKFAETHQYTIQNINEINPPQNISYEEVEEYAVSLNLYGRGSPIDIRDYQLDAIHTGLSTRRAVLLSPTGSGKSLMIYTMCRWHLERGLKCMVVVPTTSLVEQMYTDFEDYSSHNGWGVSDHCQKLYSGFSKVFEKDILFTTWQSAYTLPKAWFQQFDVVIGDEAHQYKAKALTTIMERMTTTQYKIGTTGSLDNKKLNILVLEGLFGPVHRVTTTKSLQTQGKLAPLKIKVLMLTYPEEVRKACNKQRLAKEFDYHKEIDFLVTNEMRNKVLRNLALSTSGNTLVLFQFVEKHGKVLYDLIKEKAENRNVYYVSGETKVLAREDIRQNLTEETDAIVVASYGTSATGINIPSIENIIFASPSKSVIRVLQSIGRGLRINIDKSHCNLFDITDDLHWKSWKNHALKHGAERYKIYAQEDFPIKLVEIEL